MTTTNDRSHPCHGYDAALGDVVIKLETRANQSGKSFDDVVSWVLFHRDDNMHYRLLHIAEKYHHSMDEVVDRITLMHKDWEG